MTTDDYVIVELWAGSSSHPRSRAWREADDSLHIQPLDGGYITVIAAGNWVRASTGSAAARKHLTATTPTRQPVIVDTKLY